MIKIIQNFSSKKRINEFPIVDILIWYVGLKQLKSIGHKIKLYCEEKDIPFLKQWSLFDFYDEIDTSFLPSSKIIQHVNGDNFWSIRKIECINHEFEISDEPFVYMDTDVVMNYEVKGLYDLTVWSPENDAPIYLDWNLFSTPNGYTMPEFIAKANKAYNCGIMYFKDKDIFSFYRLQYISFVYDNPCIMHTNFSEHTKKNMWACNAEQRILYAVSDYLNLKVCCVMPKQEKGVCKYGTHYYYLREGWRQMNAGMLNATDAEKWKQFLNQAILELMHALDIVGLQKFIRIKWLYDLYFYNIQIDSYK